MMRHGKLEDAEIDAAGPDPDIIERFADIVKRLEPQVVTGSPSLHITFIASIAISMKRIADHMEKRGGAW